jgi:hypothetical protein
VDQPKNNARKVNVTPLQATIEFAKRGRTELLPKLRQNVGVPERISVLSVRCLTILGGARLAIAELQKKYHAAKEDVGDSPRYGRPSEAFRMLQHGRAGQ